MVNPGGPSKGCHECRRLRVKCDETKPECVRCTDNGRKCSGYRDMFTGMTKRMYKKRSATKEASSSSSSSPRLVIPSSTRADTSCKIRRRKGLASVNDSMSQTTSFQAFIDLLEAATATSYHDNTTSDNYHYLNFLRIIQGSSKKCGSSLDLAVSAVSNIFLSFLSRNPELEDLGEEQFTAAVSLTRAALDDPTESKSDATLLSVLLLSVFENLRSVKAFRSPAIMHQIGLARMLQYRGLDSWDTEISRVCLEQFNGRLVDSVLGGRLSEMNEFLEIYRLFPQPVPLSSSSSSSSSSIDKSPIILLASFIPQISQLRLKMEDVSFGTNFDLNQLAEILSFASETDNKLSQWPKMVNPSSQPMPSASLLSEFENYNPHHQQQQQQQRQRQQQYKKNQYPQWADKYPSLIVAQSWNSYRCLRILINTYLSRCAALTRNYSLAVSADQICQEMVDGICASVPFYIGPLSSSLLSQQLQQQQQQQQDQPVMDCTRPVSALTALGAMLLMPRLRWVIREPLALRAGQTEWLQTQLESILRFYRMHGVRMG